MQTSMEHFVPREGLNAKPLGCAVLTEHQHWKHAKFYWQIEVV